MASPASGAQNPPASIGEKRKREAADIDSKDGFQQDDFNAIGEPDSVVPDNYEHSEDDGDDQPDDQDDEENVIGEIPEIQCHDESAEPFPKCAVYDNDVKAIEERVTAIAQQILGRVEEHGSSTLKSYTSKAQELCDLPTAPKLRIAILGRAGAGKSSLVNAITGKVDLAESLSGGQSCTCVPTEYQDAFPKQQQDFAASFHYLKPDGVKLHLGEVVNDYNTYAFEAADDWGEDTRITAKKAYANALKILRTLFNDLEQFKSKVSTVEYMNAIYAQRDSLLQNLANDCEEKLKLTTNRNYTSYHESSTRAKLRAKIDPLMNSTGTFEEPSLWHLLRHVSIGVRDSRVLRKVTLVDLPGISDTNESRVETTHEFIGSCDYIWIVAHISRAVDDATVFQLLSRYGKLFKGMLCVICTHSDDGIAASETNLVNHFKQEDQDVHLYLVLTSCIKAKKSEITTLKAQIAKIKRKKKSATKQQMMDVREEEESLKVLTEDFSRFKAKRFAFIVQTRNALVTKQMQNEMQSHLPRGHLLEVHCVSNSHYAALGKIGLSGPRLTAEATGIPKLRANTIALMAPRLLDSLERYITIDVKAMLQELQLWLSTASTDRRAELLELASQPRDGFPVLVKTRITRHADNVLSMVKGTLQPAIPEASKAALEQLAKKEKKHPSTIMAFIRKDGNHMTKMCPKESWNENFMKSLADVIISCLTSLSQTRLQLTDALGSAVIEDMNKFKKIIEDYPVNLPRAQLVSSIETYIRGIRHACISDTEGYEKDIRNFLLIMSQEHGKNPFTKEMRVVYEACVENKGPGITKRSLARIHKVLSDTCTRPPLASLVHVTAKALELTDKRRMGDKVQKSVSRILDQLYKTMDDLLSVKKEDKAEVAAESQLKRLLPTLLVDWEQADKGLQAAMAKYGLQPKFGRSRAMVKLDEAALLGRAMYCYGYWRNRDGTRAMMST